MDDIEATDISSWLGKTPTPELPIRPSNEQSIEAVVALPSPLPRVNLSRQMSAQSDSTSQTSEVMDVDFLPSSQFKTTFRSLEEIEQGDTGRDIVLEEDVVIPQYRIQVNVPRLSQEQKEEYEFLPGHFSVRKVLSKRDNHVVVKLESGEIQLISTKNIREFEHGHDALELFMADSRRGPSRRVTRKPDSNEMMLWNTVGALDTDSEGDLEFASHSARRNTRTDNDFAGSDDHEHSNGDDDDEIEHSDDSIPRGRRSSRLVGQRRSHNVTDLEELVDSDDLDANLNKPHRPRNAMQRQLRSKDDLAPETLASRRSERTKRAPRRSMREKGEDEISSHSEQELGPKIVATKEYFPKITEHDPFRRRHRQECDTCGNAGEYESGRGPLVFCQGCTVAYHKVCLGPRGSRDHLVTKVGDALFVLQCRRCIGVTHDKDHMAPHRGHCAACSKAGALSQPLRARLTTRQEQLQREENQGKDPITRVNPKLINNIDNVLFRCATCQRAWHMHHLPQRKLVSSQDDGEEADLNEKDLAQKRFDLYHRSWICKDCIENKILIDVIVAWRPKDVDAYIPGVTVTMMEDSKKEFLIKWRAQSYLRATWMPGDWVFGIAANAMRVAFLKKPENQLPKMTTKDAIPEDFYRVDIVFDVRYTSVVRNSSKEIDLARVKEVESAYVKYKGLGYEDAIWEKPPNYTDGQRWIDFKIAYEDYVAKVYMQIPPQSTLRRRLLEVRNQEFSNLMKKSQPSTLVGGQLMKYQLEGLNWLLYQWYTNQNAILADEMGLGKTIQLVAFFAVLIQDFKCWPFLVVVPNSTCPNWRREIQKWAPSARVVTYYGSERAKKLTQEFELFPKDKDKPEDHSKKSKAEVKDIKAHIVITSYESVSEEKTRKSLMRVPWQGLVVDEGQRLKNEKNQLYESLSKIKFPFKVLLTGTPLQNNTRELFTLLQFLDKEKNAADLDAKYAELTQENVPELHELLKPFFLRRTKAQVLTFLPPMAQIIIPVTMSTVQKKAYKSILARNPQLMKSIFSRDGPAAQKERISLNNILMQLRKTLCHPFVYSRDIEERTSNAEASHRNLVDAASKLQLLQIMLPKLKEQGHRVLMFSQFLDNLDIIEDFLDGLGMMHQRLDGSINALEKQKRIDEFNAPGSPYFAFLLSTRAGGVGINLATADTVIILDPDFNPHQDIQALSRAHRIGQQNKVLVFQLMTRGSAEEKIMQIGRKKMALDHVLIERMDQEDDAGGNLESILKHGAQALFDDDNVEEDIVYDSASVDKLLNRSHIEQTKISDSKSAESQFSFARIWANDKSSLEDEMPLDPTATNTPNPGIWDKILQERERAYEEEMARKAEQLGRGKRKRGNVDYGSRTIGEQEHPEEDKGSDNEFNENRVIGESSSSSEEDNLTSIERFGTIKVRPFKRVKIPIGAAPHFNGDGPSDYIPCGNMPPVHQCNACFEHHPLGWCRLKIAGVEHCGLCGIAHLGHGRTCPHLNDETAVESLLARLKESTESRELVEEAIKYVKLIRSDIVSRRRAQEKREQGTHAANALVNAANRIGSLVLAKNSTTTSSSHTSAVGAGGVRGFRNIHQQQPPAQLLKPLAAQQRNGFVGCNGSHK